MGSLAYTLEITRTGSEVTMLLDGVPFPYRNYGVKKTDPFLFGVILNKGKSCEIYGLECKKSIKPVNTVPVIPGKIKK
jgi:hypothetical protein